VVEKYVVLGVVLTLALIWTGFGGEPATYNFGCIVIPASVVVFIIFVIYDVIVFATLGAVAIWDKKGKRNQPISEEFSAKHETSEKDKQNQS